LMPRLRPCPSINQGVHDVLLKPLQCANANWDHSVSLSFPLPDRQKSAVAIDVVDTQVQQLVSTDRTTVKRF